MNIDSVLKMDSGKVVCVENNATITVNKKADVKNFTPSIPEGTPALSEEVFADMYKHKHFKAAEKPVAKAGDK